MHPGPCQDVLTSGPSRRRCLWEGEGPAKPLAPWGALAGWGGDRRLPKEQGTGRIWRASRRLFSRWRRNSLVCQREGSGREGEAGVWGARGESLSPAWSGRTAAWRAVCSTGGRCQVSGQMRVGGYTWQGHLCKLPWAGFISSAEREARSAAGSGAGGGGREVEQAAEGEKSFSR